MRYLKSVLFIVLVSVFAVQANANVLLPTSLKKEVKAPNNIIEVIFEGRNVQVRNNSNEDITVTLTCSVNGEIYNSTLSADNSVTLSDLAPGQYELKGSSVSGSQIVSITIE